MKTDIINDMELTQSQLLLWTGQRMVPDAPLYNMTHSFDIYGSIDSLAFQIAFQEVVNNTDALRTVFYEKEGAPFQRILERLDYKLELVDLTLVNDTFSIRETLQNRSKIKFNLSELLFDTALYRVTQNHYIWFLNIHHLITDATSSTLIYKRMSDFYGYVLESIPIKRLVNSDFRSYIISEQEQTNNKNALIIKDYWHNKVKEVTQKPVFYGMKQTASVTASKRLVLHLGKDRSLRLRELAKNVEIRSWTEHLTLFTIFATVLFGFIHRVTSQQRFVIGAPSHNRGTKSFKETVGLFIAMFPLLVEVQENDTFRALFHRVKLETNDYLKYAQAGFSSAAISRGFHVVLNYINSSFPDFHGFQVKSEWIHPGHSDPQHYLRCHIYDIDGTSDIQVLFDLNEAIFTKELAPQIPEQFLRLLDAFLDDMDLPIGQPALISTNFSEESAVSRSDLPTVMEVFERQVAISKTNLAVRCKNSVLSYEQLHERVAHLASYLRGMGIQKASKVVVHLDRSMDYIISVLAILKVGGTFVPIPSDYPIKRISFVVEDCGCNLILTNSRLKKNIQYFDKLVNLDETINYEDKPKETLELSKPDTNSLAYIIYTSGSTGNPKGVEISHRSLSNYLLWASDAYKSDEKFNFPLFTSIGFDLTITATFLPLLTGGTVSIYRESDHGPDIALFDVLEDNYVNYIKLTPSHLSLLQGKEISLSNLKTMILGGEDLKPALAATTKIKFGKDLRIFNEYGPTEATVGCIVHEYSTQRIYNASIPIGLPIKNMFYYILDAFKSQVPKGVVGELFLGGVGLANGYANLTELSNEKFIKDPFGTGKIYATGDLVRENFNGELEFIGRKDEQLKLRGLRIELADIEANLLQYPGLTDCAVVLIENEKSISENEIVNCKECGLPSNYPHTDFDEAGTCHLCNSFKGYKSQAQRYFKSEDELKNILLSKRGINPSYDCISLLSGGKDSTYILAQLVDLGLKVLAFTFDNGYISDQAKSNIDGVVKKLGVDHMYGTTSHINKIFVDSLHRHKNVCNGCFKTIYTLSTSLALEKGIPFIVTGLSRGQFFETRLTEELFWNDALEVSEIDATILEARKSYHNEEDAVKELLNTSIFKERSTFEKVQFIDFYRYCDVRLDEMLTFLEEKIGWTRPTDTGRSTNCLINQLGIFVHKKERGYSNYAFPYSWDVRLGHKTREESLAEINEDINEDEVRRIMKEIGYVDTQISDNDLTHPRLVAYYTAPIAINSKDIVNHLRTRIPEYMVPSKFKRLESFPLTTNGKVDKSTLKNFTLVQLDMEVSYIAPNGEIEEILAHIWEEVLHLKKVGSEDNFIDLGGHSLAAIRITARVNEELEMQIPLNKIFEFPTISQYSKFIENKLIELLN